MYGTLMRRRMYVLNAEPMQWFVRLSLDLCRLGRARFGCNHVQAVTPLYLVTSASFGVHQIERWIADYRHSEITTATRDPA